LSTAIPPRARVREGRAAIRCREAYFRAWRIAKFGGDFDQKTSEIEEMAREHKFLRNPASSFQKLLNKRFPLPKEGAA